MAPLWSSQPFKALYVTYILVKLPTVLTLLWVTSVVRGLRAHREWTVKQCVGNRFLRTLFHTYSRTRTHRPLHVPYEKLKDRYVVVEPPAASLFTGVLAPSDAIAPVNVDTLWFPRAPPAAADEATKLKVLLHLPGGAFVVALSHEAVAAPLAEVALEGLEVDRVVWAQYRLAESPKSRFPAAVQDALTAYHHLLSMGVRPDNIVLSGDSAGANVALALIRYLQSLPSQPVPLPSAVLLISPYVDVHLDVGVEFSKNPDSNIDIITGEFLQWGAEQYLPPAPMGSDVQPYVSPANHPFKVHVPLYIQAGGCEGLCPQIRAFAGAMEKVEGNRVRYDESPLATHDLPLSWPNIGMRKEAIEVMIQAKAFFRG